MRGRRRATETTQHASRAFGPGFPSVIARWLCHVPIGAMAVLTMTSVYSLAGVPSNHLNARGHALVVGTYINGIVVCPMPGSKHEH